IEKWNTVMQAVATHIQVMNLINSNRDSHNGCLFLWNKKGRYLAIPLNEHRGGVEFDCVTVSRPFCQTNTMKRSKLWEIMM
ncbi:hypothetical protein EON19_15390, partial [Listeria monocytogenes]|nr:hypothetical protein [Listeria monocytogenes]